MSFGQTFGRVLFIVFLIVRGAQHINKPDDWHTKFAVKYREYFDFHTKLPFITENVPGDWLNLLHPQYISVFATRYGPYLGYTELLLAACILLQIPLLPLIGATFLLVETLVFFNPLKGAVGNELYYLIVNLAIVAIAYMMAFAPPLVNVKKIKEKVSHVAQQARAAAAGATTGGSKPARSNSGKRTKRE